MSKKFNCTDISIIIPVYNRYHFLKKCLYSIRLQNFSKYEVIVIDDASTERMDDLRRYCDLFIRNNINLGPAYSRNIGALRSKGRILLFLDCDTVLISNTLLNINAFFEREPSVSGLGGSGPPDKSGKDAEYMRGKSYNRFGVSKTTRHSPKDDDFRIYDYDNIESAFLAVRREVFNELGGFDPYWFYMGEDRDFCLSLKEHGYRLALTPHIRAIHYHKHSVAYEEEKEYKIFLEGRYLEVEIKKDGMLGGILWMAGNLEEIFQLHSFFYLIKKFKHIRKIRKRKNVNFLDKRQLEEYYRIKLKESVENKLSINIEFPLPTPKNIVLFITSKCNARCAHCFVSPKHNDLNEKDIRKIVDSLNTDTSISITGGEPFLRDDLGGILSYIVRSSKVRDIKILSNGSFPERMESICTGFCREYNKPLNIQISLDGFFATHYEIRKIKDGFEKVIDSCRKAKALSTKYLNISFNVAMTIMKNNIKEIEGLIDYLNQNKFPSKISLVRGNSFSTFCVPREIINNEYEPNCEEIRVDVGEIKALINRIDKKYPWYFNHYQKKKLKIMVNTLVQKKRCIPCYAGYKDAVIYSDGGIALCEQVVPYGNLSSWGWNVSDSWNSTAAWEHRNKLTGCSCIHGCNIITSIKQEEREIQY